MAFVLGCGVYALTLELARMHARGLLAVGSRRAARPQPRGPGPAAGRPASPGGGQDAGSAGDGDAGPGPSLPRRRKTNPSAPRRPQNAAGQQGSSSALLRLLRHGPMTDQAAGE